MSNTLLNAYKKVYIQENVESQITPEQASSEIKEVAKKLLNLALTVRNRGHMVNGTAFEDSVGKLVEAAGSVAVEVIKNHAGNEKADSVAAALREIPHSTT
jgi:predicted amino acid dehydrogenase